MAMAYTAPLVVSLLTTVVLQLSCFAIAFACQMDKITDLAGTSNFVVIALGTLVAYSHYTARQIVLSTFVCIWGLRLGAFLLERVLRRGHDARFNDMRRDCGKFLGFWVAQIIWVWIVSLPVIFVNASPVNPGIGALDLFGWAIWLTGAIVEFWADQTKRDFREDDINRGLLRTGVWRWSRHPNYFGEICCWVGIFLSSSVTFVGWEFVSVLSPILTTTLLMFVSGIPLAEARYDARFGLQHFYIEYKKSTSPIIPFPPTVYKNFPDIVKKILFCELNRYSRVLNSQRSMHASVDH
ncbi:Protein of unknown function (DUF1295) [Plasmodiophora brassicae]